MSDDDRVAVDAAPLSEIGLPESLCSWVERQRYPQEWKRRTSKRLFVIMGFFIAGYILTSAARAAGGQLTRHLRTRHLAGPFHYEGPEVLSLLVLLFSTGFVASYLHFSSRRKNTPQMRDYDLLANLSEAASFPGFIGNLSRRYFRWTCRTVVAASPRDQLEQLRDALRRAYLVPGIWLAVLGSFLFVREMLAFQLATKEGAAVRDPLTFHSADYSWDDLAKVGVACWVFPRDGLSLEYTATFQDGTEVPLFTRHVKPDEVRLAEFVESIALERAIKKTPIRFTFGIHTGETKVQPDCRAQINQVYTNPLAVSLASLVEVRP